MTILATPSTFTLWTDLSAHAAPLVPECPRHILELALRDACRDFFTVSRCWRERGLTLITTVAGQAAYTFNPSANAELSAVMAAWDGDDEIEVGHPGEDDDSYPTEQDDETYRVTVANGGATLLLSPLPETAAVVIKGSVAYTVASNATGILTWVYNEHRRGLAAGAAALLVVQPKKPWTDRDAYAAHQSAYETALRRASNKAGPLRRRPLTVASW